METKLKDISGNLLDVQRQYPPQTAEEERAMCEDPSIPREKLRELLVLHNVGFARDFVRRYGEQSETMEDMWMRGIQGLSTAAQSYDPASGCRFCSYAGRIIQTAMRDLFDENMAGQRTQQATRAVLDAPCKPSDDADGNAIGEYLMQHSCVAGWTAPAYGNVEKKLYSGDYDSMVAYLAARFTEPGIRRQSVEMLLRGRTLDSIGLVTNRTHQAVWSSVKPVLEKIQLAIWKAKPGDELYDALGCMMPRTKKGESISLGTVCQKLSQSGVEILPDGTFEDPAAREMRLMAEYEEAEKMHRVATGRRDGGADYSMMARVYLATIVRGDAIDDCACRLHIPVTYARFLRSRAREMLKQAKSGSLRQIVRRGDVGVKEHQLKDDLFNTVEYRTSGFTPSVGLVNSYSSMFGRMGVRTNKSRWICTWKRFYGGFYSHSNYLRMSGRFKDGKVRISKREAAALAQFGT